MSFPSLLQHLFQNKGAGPLLKESIVPAPSIINAYSLTRDSDLESGSIYTVPCYVKDKNRIRVFIAGLRAIKGVTFEEYTETQIKFLSTVSKNDSILIEVISYNSDIDKDQLEIATSYSSYRSKDIDIDGLYTVPSYIVGSNTLSIYINGIKAENGIAYQEVGNTNERSSVVKFLNLIPKTYTIECKVFINIVSISSSVSGTRESDIPVGGYFTVPAYSVDNNSLKVYMDGLVLEKDIAYKEINSTTIQFLVAIEKERALSFESISNATLSHFYSNQRESVLYKDSYYTVPQYIANDDKLTIYFDGVKATVGESYKEIGEVGDSSTTIQLLQNIDTNISITVEAISL